ncbi:MAG: metalloregulator ArsR/SmtB family transcription factor [Candidatus Cloacimonetes bacterium]|nr:metalloregulator ArsR/SmtB family transcription factor [Candidatus Cloacimonadota bacterium]
MNVIDLIKCLADESRLNCLKLIMLRGEQSVGDLTQTLNLPQPRVSRHLAQLRLQKVLLDRRQGQWVYYGLHPELPRWAKDLIQTAVTPLKLDIENEKYQDDTELCLL